MAGLPNASGRFLARAVRTAAASAGLSLLAGGTALAQAPIVYKTSASVGHPQPRLESHTDSLSLTVAPHAPIPTFAGSRAIDLRPGAAAASFGPAPMASAGVSEPLPLRTAIASVRPNAAEQAISPYAGPPYQVAGKWYVPAHEPNYDEVGIASWYGPTFHGKASASGEVFDQDALTAAHPTLPIPSLVRVTNLENGRTVVVRLNDRGPFVDDRIIDLSRAAGAALDMHAKGTARVRVQYVGPAPVEGGGKVAASAPPVAAPARIDVVATPLQAVVQPTTYPVLTTGVPVTGYYVQTGSFGDLANAHAMRDRLSPQGQISIEAAGINGAEFYRVLVGPWPDRQQADQARQRLVSAGAQAMIVNRTR